MSTNLYSGRDPEHLHLRPVGRGVGKQLANRILPELKDDKEISATIARPMV